MHAFARDIEVLYYRLVFRFRSTKYVHSSLIVQAASFNQQNRNILFQSNAFSIVIKYKQKYETVTMFFF